MVLQELRSLTEGIYTASQPYTRAKRTNRIKSRTIEIIQNKETKIETLLSVETPLGWVLCCAMERTPSRMGLLSRSLSTSGFPGDRRGLPVAYGINRVPHRAREMLSDQSDQ